MKRTSPEGLTYEYLYGGNGLGAYPDGGFMVPAGGLGKSVITFTLCAVIAIAILVARRFVYGGELGGTMKGKLISASALVFLWCLYIGLSIWFTLSAEDAS